MRSLRTWILVATLAASLGACSEPERRALSTTPQEPEPIVETNTPTETAASDPTEQIEASELLRNGRIVDGAMLLGGQPTTEQFGAISEAGYLTVVNLRRESEEGNTVPADVETAGMSYVHLPVAGKEGINEANARALDEALGEAEGPVVVHCGSGNRVGALFALRAFYVDGAAPADALQLGLDYGMTSLEPTVREILGVPVPEADDDAS